MTRRRRVGRSGSAASPPDTGRAGGPVTIVPFLAAVLFLVSDEPLPADTLIAPSAIWKFDVSGADLGTGWRAADFDDAHWAEGPAELGFGDGDEQTVLTRHEENNFTYYFRHRFNITDPGLYGELKLRLLRDDGCVLYLNGTELLRSNMPEGPIEFETLAGFHGDEYTWYEFLLDARLFSAGSNVLAVEVHQAATASGDISLALTLEGLESLRPLCSEPLQGHWKFDEGAGSVALDATGSQEALLMNMDATSRIPGVVGEGALEFDGVDDYVSIPSAACFDFLEDFTWVAWARAAHAGENGPIIARSPDEGEFLRDSKALYIDESGRLVFRAASQSMRSTGRVDDGAWRHVAVSVEFRVFPFWIDGRATIYVDGEADGLRDPWPFHYWPDTDAMKIGFGSPVFPWGHSHFAGAIDDVQIYNVALAAEEVRALAGGRPTFRRGDANADSLSDLSDGVFIFLFLFRGDVEPPCIKGADVDDSGEIDLTDGIALLNYLFRSGPEPFRPFGQCGVDPTADDLPCESSPPCE